MTCRVLPFVDDEDLASWTAERRCCATGVDLRGNGDATRLPGMMSRWGIEVMVVEVHSVYLSLKWST